MATGNEDTCLGMVQQQVIPPMDTDVNTFLRGPEKGEGKYLSVAKTKSPSLSGPSSSYLTPLPHPLLSLTTTALQFRVL